MEDIIKPSKDRKYLDGFALGRLRDDLGLTQESFAHLCGWTRQYQSKLESSKHDVPCETADTIEAVIGVLMRKKQLNS